ncbi:TolC family protein [Winogradskyella eckloniae]|uniref:TolC family protein n=1 Tax=Winogradskyella eckloniae TaxID=1089306 RepID=UPI001566C162|nr:TolC family protein [Winogradskyella eckloniae]NRD21216.1 TolC family protein [Winogradskyella eckloniae]
MRHIITLVFFSFSLFTFSQSTALSNVLRFDEYLGFVKKYHPIVKQAELVIDESQAQLMKSRGAFDPKFEIDYNRKTFKNTDYYDKLNGAFKIPTWFGIELKAAFEENTGEYLNPEAYVPEDGLYNAGLSLPLAQGLLINNRMAALKQAKLFKEQAKADRDIYVNTILFEASLVYFKWLQAYNELLLFENILENADLRYSGIKKGVIVGENAKIDETEARIAVNNRRLGLEQSKVKLMKAALELSNFLWLENNIPLELQPHIIPDVNSEPIIDATFNINTLQTEALTIEEHPKMRSLDYKLQGLEVNKRLKTNKLLPKINLEYNFLSQTPETSSSFNTSDYKSGLSLSLPLFLRKERADLKLAKIKLIDTEYEINATRVSLENKVTAIKQELDSYIKQNEITSEMVSDYEMMLMAEERKFQLGESSLFLVNARESELIDGKLKAIAIQNKFFNTKAKLFNSLAINPLLN